MKKTCYTPKKGVDRVQTLCYDEDPRRGTNPSRRKGLTAMTTTGKVFKAYAEKIVSKHGFGSNKMVAQGSPDFISNAIMRGQRLIDKGRHAENSTGMYLEEFEAALAGKEEGYRIWDELSTAEEWLLENGYLRKYNWATYNQSYHISFSRCGVSIGLTDKGWAVAQKYLDSDY